MRKMMKIAALLALPLAVVIGLGAVARADGDEEGERMRPVADEVVKKECGACHMAYQPGFLPADSWRRIMDDLKNHFGEDASLDEATAKRITDYLVANAGSGRGGNASLRISEQPWFVREHRKEVSPRMREKAKTMANCVACHKGAEQGWYEDD